MISGASGRSPRLHSSLKYQTSKGIVAARYFYKMQWAHPIELLDGSAPVALPRGLVAQIEV